MNISTNNYIVEISYHKGYSKGFYTRSTQGQYRANEEECKSAARNLQQG